jgi:hypothetical protein
VPKPAQACRRRLGPGVDGGLLIEEVHCGHDAVLEFLFGCDAG